MIRAYLLCSILVGSWHSDRALAVDPDTLRKTRPSHLVKLLTEEDTRLPAFFELSHRAGLDTPDSFDAFRLGCQNPQLVLCPQGEDKSPLYVVLYEHLHQYDHYEQLAYPPADRLFQPKDNGPVRLREVAIEAFTASGRYVMPFGGDNALDDGMMFDINRDGIIERADSTSYGLSRRKSAAVLEVSAVYEEALPLFAVVYDWDTNTWAYNFTDRDRDGIIEIELGPACGDGIDPQVTYRWDGDRKTYTGPAGSPGDHYRVIDARDIEAELRRLEKEKLTFPPSKVPEMAREPGPTRVPDDFWEQKPKSLALAIAEANRVPPRSEDLRLAIDDLDGLAPPNVCTIALSNIRLACGRFCPDIHYFLRCDPRGSYLAYVRQDREEEHDPANAARTNCHLRYVPIEYGQARHVAHTIWWLNRVRSRGAGPYFTPGGSYECSTDGSGRLRLMAEDRKERVEATGTVWLDPVSERASGLYDKETFLNLSAHLLSVVLPERLGNRWDQDNPHAATSTTRATTSAPANAEGEQARQRELATRFLAMYTPDERRISRLIARVAATAAGDRKLADALPHLRRIAAHLPQTTPDLETAIADLEVRLEQPGSIGPHRAELLERLAAMRSDLMVEDDTGKFGEAIRSAIRQIRPNPPPPGQEKAE